LCCCVLCLSAFFFFQAEDGIRDFHVTGVQTCALPIYPLLGRLPAAIAGARMVRGVARWLPLAVRTPADVRPGGRRAAADGLVRRSEERRVGKECRYRGGREP